MSPRGGQPDNGLFSEEEKKEYTQIEGLYPERETIRNKAPEGKISTMVVVKWSDAIKFPRVKLDGLLCGALYKDGNGSIVPWSGTYPYDKLHRFSTMKSSITGEDLSIMVNSAQRPSIRREEQR